MRINPALIMEYWDDLLHLAARSERVPLLPRRFSKSWLLHRIRVSWPKPCGSSAVSSDPCL
ncbi:hypothetical protein MESS4_330084 [Mesorhizobium sp. STM 4661]|nr:hypothetical protein MESS4_330084 [Mesorhizobium sp. STM 4661]